MSDDKWGWLSMFFITALICATIFSCSSNSHALRQKCIAAGGTIIEAGSGFHCVARG